MDTKDLKAFHEEQIAYIDNLDRVLGGKLKPLSVEDYLAFLKSQDHPLSLELLIASMQNKSKPNR